MCSLREQVIVFVAEGGFCRGILMVSENSVVKTSVTEQAARPEIRCIIYPGCNPGVAVSSLKVDFFRLTKDSAVLGKIITHAYTGSLHEPEERQKLVRSLGPISKAWLLNIHGALCCGETVDETFYAACHILQAQRKILPVGLDNLVLLPEEARKAIYEVSRKPPEGFELQKLGMISQPSNQKTIRKNPGNSQALSLVGRSKDYPLAPPQLSTQLVQRRLEKHLRLQQQQLAASVLLNPSAQTASASTRNTQVGISNSSILPAPTN